MSFSQFLEVFSSVSLQAALYVLVCAFLVRLTSNDQTRWRIWSNCQIGLLVLVFVALSFPHLRLFPIGEIGNEQQLSREVTRQYWIAGIIGSVWAAGALVLVGRLIVASGRLLLFFRRLEKLTPEAERLSNSIKRPHQLAHVQIYLCDGLDAPFCWQFQNPVIVLPKHFLEYSDHELGLVLNHEFAHLTENHSLDLFLQQFVKCLFWFHPLVLWAARKNDLYRELMCDAVAARSRQEIQDYLRLLIRVMERSQVGTTGPLRVGVSFAARRSEIQLRAKRMEERALNNGVVGEHSLWLPRGALFATVVVTLVWLPIDALSSPRAVWSACPRWTAELLHEVGVSTRDFEVYDRRLQIFDEPSVGPQFYD
ncbi:M56 family metallopeptidase [Planctomicrobium sp. SH668]|uniref:M56 family metallopeptidase n=1 Tax=Planctomicrobium sp. SH668 TaxID=3448126 RepID=UPI003F5BBBC5